MVPRATRWQRPGRAPEIISSALDGAVGARGRWIRSTLLGWRRFYCTRRGGVRSAAVVLKASVLLVHALAGQVLVTMTLHQMVVDHADRLHEGIDDGGPHE